MTDYSRLPLMTPERIRHNKAIAARRRAGTAHREAQAVAAAAAETYRAALAEEVSALRALNESLGISHGTNTD